MERTHPRIVATALRVLCCGFATEAAARQTMQALPIPGPVRDVGVYHVATDTWTRDGNQESLGSKVLYSNTANTGFFGYMGVPCDLVWTDEGRIPSTSGHANAKSDSYIVTGFQLAYCTSVIGHQQAGLAFYECYATCTDPTTACPVRSIDLALPVAQSCWLVTIDLKGSSLEFTLDGDCDEAFDGTTALDNFGWTLTMYDQGSGGFNGPFLNGDPNNYPYGDGAPPAAGSRNQCWKCRVIPTNAARLCLVSELSYVQLAELPAARTTAPRVMPPVVHMNPLPNGVCDWFMPWKKMLDLLGTGVEVSVRSPATELAEPVAERSAGAPVALALAVQYFVKRSSTSSRKSSQARPPGSVME